MFQSYRKQKIRDLLKKNDLVVAYDGTTYYFYWDPLQANYMVLSSALQRYTLDEFHVPKWRSGPEPICADPKGFSRPYEKLVQIIDFLKARNVPEDALANILTVHNETLFVTKGLHTNQFIGFHIPGKGDFAYPRVVLNNASLGAEQSHPYSLAVVSKADPYTLHPNVKRLIRLIETEDPKKWAYASTIPFNAIPGLSEKVGFRVVFDLQSLDNSAHPIFDIREICEGVKWFEHKVPEWELHVGRIEVLFGQNPNPVRIDQLLNDFPQHRFYMSDTPVRRSHETYYKSAHLPEKIA